MFWQKAGHRARREPLVEEDHGVRGAHEPARDRNPNAIPRELAVKEPGPLEPHEPVLQRVQPLHRHFAHHSTARKTPLHAAPSRPRAPRSTSARDLATLFWVWFPS